MNSSPSHPVLTEPARHGFHPAMALAALVLLCLASVIWVRFSGQDIHVKDDAPLVTRALRFEDRLDGSIAVIDPANGAQVLSIQGEQGFVRGVLRALARERKKHGLGSEQPFELIARQDGRLTLHDPATNARIDLEAFGPTNVSVFSRLLTPPTPSLGK